MLSTHTVTSKLLHFQAKSRSHSLCERESFQPSAPSAPAAQCCDHYKFLWSRFVEQTNRKTSPPLPLYPLILECQDKQSGQILIEFDGRNFKNCSSHVFQSLSNTDILIIRTRQELKEIRCGLAINWRTWEILNRLGSGVMTMNQSTLRKQTVVFRLQWRAAYSVFVLFFLYNLDIVVNMHIIWSLTARQSLSDWIMWDPFKNTIKLFVCVCVVIFKD